MAGGAGAGSDELPLFPLGTVLLPGGPLALRIFEPRYLDMVARCLRGRNRFGVVGIREGAEAGAATFYDVGTAAEIVDWHQEAGGLLGVRAQGRECFRIEASRRERDGLYVGRVVWLPEPAAAPVPPHLVPLAQLLRKLHEQTPVYREEPRAYDDSAWVAARLAEALSLQPEKKQTLLQTADASAWLELVAEWLGPLPGKA